MSTVIIILTGAVITLACVIAFLALTAPRETDYFEHDMAELAALTSGSDHWPPDGSESGGAADVLPIPPSGPVFSLIDEDDGFVFTGFDERAGASAPVKRERPVLFRVK